MAKQTRHDQESETGSYTASEPTTEQVEQTPTPLGQPQATDGELKKEAEDLLRVASRLEEVSRSFRRQQEEYLTVGTARQELQRAMGSALRGIETLTERFAYPSVETPCHERPQCEPCQCVHSNCCCFDFIFRRVRVVAGQVGVDATLDGEVTTGLAGGRAGMECQFFVSINGSGIIVPNQIWSYIQLIKRRNKPGVWYEIERSVNKVCVPKGKPLTVPFFFQAVEREVGTTEVVLGLEEFGASTAEVTFDCCCPKVGPVYLSVAFEGAGGGGGEVEGVFEGIRICA